MNADPQLSTQMHILVAEDSPINQRLAQGLLRRQGHAVTVVSNGLEALSALAMARFDAVLMDVEMPELDGLSATRLIRAAELQAGRRVPIVAVTTKDNAAECLRAGMDAHLEKPLQSLPLSRILAHLSGKTAALPRDPALEIDGHRSVVGNG
jgi:CheY-like chemotaxis protein